jgi:hypothetical protein
MGTPVMYMNCQSTRYQKCAVRNGRIARPTRLVHGGESMRHQCKNAPRYHLLTAREKDTRTAMKSRLFECKKMLHECGIVILHTKSDCRTAQNAHDDERCNECSTTMSAVENVIAHRGNTIKKSPAGSLRPGNML